MSIFQAKPNKPFHLSAGAIVLDDSGKVLCHYCKKLRGGENIYILMRETVEDDANIFDTVHRGLMEEFGAEAEIQNYIDSLIAEDKWFGEIDQTTLVQKTTIYFLCKLKSIDDNLRLKDHPEFGSEIVRMDIDELTEKMKINYEKYKWNFIREFEVLERIEVLNSESINKSIGS